MRCHLSCVVIDCAPLCPVGCQMSIRVLTLNGTHLWQWRLAPQLVGVCTVSVLLKSWRLPELSADGGLLLVALS